MPGWAWVLLVIWGCLLFGGLLFGRPAPGDTRRMPTATRMLSSFTLVVAAAAWSWAAQQQGSALTGTMALMAVGMFCGWLGDLTLAEIIPLRKRVLAGMALFGLGHLAYIAGLLAARGYLGVDNMGAGKGLSWFGEW